MCAFGAIIFVLHEWDHTRDQIYRPDEAGVSLKSCRQQKCAILDKSAPCIPQNHVSKEIKYPEGFKSHHMMFINCNNNYDQQKDSIMFPVKKNKTQKGSQEKNQRRNWCGGIFLKTLQCCQKYITMSNVDLDQGGILMVSNLYKTWKQNVILHNQHRTQNC